MKLIIFFIIGREQSCIEQGGRPSKGKRIIAGENAMRTLLTGTAAVLACAVSLHAIESLPLAGDTTAFYRLDGNAADASGNGFNGTPVGAAFVSDAERDQVAQFDDNSYIAVRSGRGASTGLPTQAITVAAWVTVVVPDVWGGFMGLVRDNGSDESGWCLGTRNNQFSFALRSRNGSALTYLTDDAAFTSGIWYHVAGTYDGTTQKIFVNGALKKTSAVQSGVIVYPDSGWFDLGRYKDENEDYRHDGKLDNAIIISRALTDAEVLKMYQDSRVKILQWDAAVFYEADANDGSIRNALTVRLRAERFSIAAGPMTQGTHFSVLNLPAGLQISITAANDTTAAIALAGKANAHTNLDDVSSLTVTFLNAAFAGGAAGQVRASSRNDLKIDFFTLLPAQVLGWRKGQLHCHTTNSDGQLSPSAVCGKYRSDGYSFVCITDHGTLTNATAYTTTGFITIPSTELAPSAHVNAFNVSRMPAGFSSVQGAIDSSFAAGANLVQVNHPWWSGLSAQTVAGYLRNQLLEVCNADDPQHTYDEAVWDTLLGRGRRIFGTGDDDAHDYSASSVHYNECWVMVSADTLTIPAIMTAMKSGDFYFVDRGPTIGNPGILLSRIDMFDRTLAVYSVDGTRITFKGMRGQVLQTVNASAASFSLPAGQPYVRAVVTNSISGQYSYTQAYFPNLFTLFSGKIISPLDSAVFVQGSSVPLVLQVYANKDSLASIKFYANDTLIGSIASHDTTFLWSNPPVGKLVIKAKFITTQGVYYWSNPVTIKVTPATYIAAAGVKGPGSDIVKVYATASGARVKFVCRKPGILKVEVFSIDGTLRKVLFSQFAGRGPQEVVWNGSDRYGRLVPSGMYLIKIQAEGMMQVLSASICR